MDKNSASIAEILCKSAVIFWDFDGVIKESTSIKSLAFQKLFSRYGHSVVEAVGQHDKANPGISRYEKIPLYLTWANEEITEELVSRFCDLFSKSVLQSVIDSPWVPGVREWLLSNFKKKHFFLVTATPQHEIEKILTSLDIVQCFQGIFGAPLKKEEAIRSVLDKKNSLRDKALMIGDSEADFLAANAASVPFLLRKTDLNGDFRERFPGPKFEDIKYEQM